MSAAARRIMRLRCYILEDAVRDLDRRTACNGPEHPATQAARGRLWVHLGRVPQQGQATPQAVAWERESGRTPGYMNRTQRRHHATAP